ncbi:MAG TPA: sterol desaturase family protein [Polyangiaceae bacterium]|nr:sterol desaturase family protein [Polyangiaceae bacterium]
MESWQVSAVVASCVLLPVGLAVATSPEIRRALRGTGSVRQTLSNAGVGVLFLVTQVGLRGALIGAYAGAAALVPWKLPLGRPESWLFAFFFLELIYYVQHRLEHRIPLLWAVHVVHHQSRDYNLSVSLRVGVLSSLTTTLFHLPLALLGVSLEQYALLSTIHAGLLSTLHARTRLALGPGRFFNAPVFHRVHHASDSSYIDKNFGGVLLVFDRLFGTFTPLANEPTYGVAAQASPLNPLDANVAPWRALRAQVRELPTLRAKLKALFVDPR